MFVLTQDRNGESGAVFEWKEEKIHKIFMGVQEVQEFLEVNRTTAYQLFNEMMMKNDKGQSHSPTYLRTIQAQLSGILNHDCKFYSSKTMLIVMWAQMVKREQMKCFFG